jgi:hypothetical protein
MVDIKDILSKFYDGEQWEPAFVQAFVAEDGRILAREFIRYFDVKVSFAQLNSAILDIGHTKLIKFAKVEENPDHIKLFKEAYVFGKFEHARDWVIYLHEAYGVTLNRATVLTHISLQRPEKCASSFLPAAMQEKHYDREVKEPVH